MSDMSINAMSSGATSTLRTQAQTASASVAAAAVSASVSQGSSVDYSNRVDNLKGIVDPNSGVFVIQQREGATGKVKNEYPSKQVVAAYRRNEAAAVKVSAPVPSGSSDVKSATTTTTTTTASTTDSAPAVSTPVAVGGASAPTASPTASPTPAPTTTSVDA